MSSTFFFIVSEALSNVQFCTFLSYLNSHFCIHCRLNQKFRGTSPDTSFSLLSNINRLPIPHMPAPIITHMGFSFPPSTFPLFSHLCYCKHSLSRSFHLPPVILYPSLHNPREHSNTETKPCWSKDYNDPFKIRPSFFIVTLFAFTTLASSISGHYPRYNLPSGNTNPLFLPWLCIALHEFVNFLLKASCKDSGDTL